MYIFYLFIHTINKVVKVVKNRDYNNYYLSCDLVFLTTKEKKRLEALNDYGYNFNSSKRKIINIEKECGRTGNCVNKVIFEQKR